MIPARGYFATAPGRGELRPLELPPPRPGECLLQGVCSGISAGTERLVGQGLVPERAFAAMRCAHMRGTFPFPVQYGYCWIGTVADGPDAGRRAFTMHPHQDRIVVPRAELHGLPDELPDARATLLPNLETAQNAVWDADLTGDEPVLIVGGGVVGLLLAFVLRAHRGTVVLAEQHPQRAAAIASLPWLRQVQRPEAVPRGAFAVAFHATGHGAGLQTAIDGLGFEGRVVDLSWYGTRPVTLDLGGDFHWQRLSILSSQVGHVGRSQRGRLRSRERMAAVIELAARHGGDLDRLVDGAGIPFAALPAFMSELCRGAATAPMAVVAHGSLPGRAFE
ncbi:MAG: zinc-binding alcohol dehydrogenase [Planctomycetes bacterium]|nr:zinc-binding alcohol dehydrogenase [Planctomycetota bacterium]